MLAARAAGVGRGCPGMMADGTLVLEQVDPAEFSPGEFAHRIRHLVEQGGVRPS